MIKFFLIFLLVITVNTSYADDKPSSLLVFYGKDKAVSEAVQVTEKIFMSFLNESATEEDFNRINKKLCGFFKGEIKRHENVGLKKLDNDLIKKVFVSPKPIKTLSCVYYNQTDDESVSFYNTQLMEIGINAKGYENKRILTILTLTTQPMNVDYSRNYIRNGTFPKKEESYGLNDKNTLAKMYEVTKKFLPKIKDTNEEKVGKALAEQDVREQKQNIKKNILNEAEKMSIKKTPPKF